MKRDVVEIYINIVIWTSLIIILWSLISNPLNEAFSYARAGSVTWWIFIIIVPSIFGLIGFVLLAYSLIMLVYIIAKRRREEYIFAFAVPILLFGIPFILNNTGMLHILRIDEIFFDIILFLYALYHRWRK